MKKIALVLICLLSVMVMVVAVRCKRSDEANRDSAHEGVPAIIVQKDYSAWYREFGVEVQDTDSAAGRMQKQKEAARLSVAREDFRGLLETLPCVYTNDTNEAAKKFLLQVDALLNGFGRESCAALLKCVERGSGNADLPDEIMQTEEMTTRVIGRYCEIFGRFADMLWERAGEDFAAAEVDRSMFSALKRCRSLCKRRGWPGAEKVANEWLEKFQIERCDSEKSNYCRAHNKCEKEYDAYFKDAIERGQTSYKKITERWYRLHLNSARYILGREPKWSPNFKAK